VGFWQRHEIQARSMALRAAILWIQRGRAWVRASRRAEACLQALCMYVALQMGRSERVEKRRGGEGLEVTRFTGSLWSSCQQI